MLQTEKESLNIANPQIISSQNIIKQIKIKIIITQHLALEW